MEDRHMSLSGSLPEEILALHAQTKDLGKQVGLLEARRVQILSHDADIPQLRAIQTKAHELLENIEVMESQGFSHEHQHAISQIKASLHLVSTRAINCLKHLTPDVSDDDDSVSSESSCTSSSSFEQKIDNFEDSYSPVLKKHVSSDSFEALSVGSTLGGLEEIEDAGLKFSSFIALLKNPSLNDEGCQKVLESYAFCDADIPFLLEELLMKASSIFLRYPSLQKFLYNRIREPSGSTRREQSQLVGLRAKMLQLLKRKIDELDCPRESEALFENIEDILKDDNRTLTKEEYDEIVEEFFSEHISLDDQQKEKLSSFFEEVFTQRQAFTVFLEMAEKRLQDALQEISQVSDTPQLMTLCDSMLWTIPFCNETLRKQIAEQILSKLETLPPSELSRFDSINKFFEILSDQDLIRSVLAKHVPYGELSSNLSSYYQSFQKVHDQGFFQLLQSKLESGGTGSLVQMRARNQAMISEVQSSPEYAKEVLQACYHSTKHIVDKIDSSFSAYILCLHTSPPSLQDFIYNALMPVFNEDVSWIQSICSDLPWKIDLSQDMSNQLDAIKKKILGRIQERLFPPMGLFLLGDSGVDYFREWLTKDEPSPTLKPTFGPLQISVATQQLQIIVDHLFQNLDSVDCIKEGETVYVMCDGIRYNLREILSQANLEQVQLRADQLDQYDTWLASPTSNIKYRPQESSFVLVKPSAEFFAKRDPDGLYGGLHIGEKCAINVYTGDANTFIIRLLSGRFDRAVEGYDPRGSIADETVRFNRCIKEGLLHSIVAISGLRKIPDFIGSDGTIPKYLFRGDSWPPAKTKIITDLVERGGDFSLEPLLSTSYQQPVAGWVKNIGILLENSHGKDVTGLSQYDKSEREILLPPVPLQWMYHKQALNPFQGNKPIDFFMARPLHYSPRSQPLL